MTAIVKARAAHPGRFAAIDPAHDADHTRELNGFLPWTISEYYEKLQSGFSTLAALENHGGTQVEIENARQNSILEKNTLRKKVSAENEKLKSQVQTYV